MKKLRVALAGLGRIADKRRQGSVACQRAELAAICDADAEVLLRRAAQWRVEKTYASFDNLLDDPDVDAVDIATPHYLHARMAIAALEAGKNVSVQKPMALNIGEADAMIDAAARSGRLLRVIDNYRFHPPYVRAKELLDAGAIGEPQTIRIKTASGTAPDGWDIPDSSHAWRSDPALSGEGSVLFDHGHHLWMLARYLLGDVERVFTYHGRAEVDRHHEIVSGGALDNPALVAWKYAGRDVFGCCESTHSEAFIVRSRHYPIDVSVDITGSLGILRVNRGPNGQIVESPAVTIARGGELTIVDDLETDYAAGFRLAVDDFARAAIEGGTSDLTGEEAREVLRFSLAIVRSGREGGEVIVRDVR